MLVHIGQPLSNSVVLAQYRLINMSNTRVGLVTELALSKINTSPVIRPELVQPVVVVPVEVRAVEVARGTVHLLASLEVAAVGAEGRHGSPVVQAAAGLVPARHALGMLALLGAAVVVATRSHGIGDVAEDQLGPNAGQAAQALVG